MAHWILRIPPTWSWIPVLLFDDDRVEIIGDKGILIINRCTAKTLDYPPLVLFKDGKTTEIPVDRYEWHDSFIDCTRHLIDVLTKGGDPHLDGKTARSVLNFHLVRINPPKLIMKSC